MAIRDAAPVPQLASRDARRRRPRSHHGPFTDEYNVPRRNHALLTDAYRLSLLRL
jgi:hypothetical protein